MRQQIVQALGLVLALGAALGLLHAWGVGLWLLLGLAVGVIIVAGAMPLTGVKLLDAIVLRLRAFHWRREQGRHHSFGGMPLRIEDDGRHVWVAAEGWQRVQGRRDGEDILAARFAGRWRRDDDGELWLRVDAVAEFLVSAPGRMDPRTVRLRRYFERDVLFPAAERRRRG